MCVAILWRQIPDGKAWITCCCPGCHKGAKESCNYEVNDVTKKKVVSRALTPSKLAEFNAKLEREGFNATDRGWKTDASSEELVDALNRGEVNYEV
jgi:hypothetical protein